MHIGCWVRGHRWVTTRRCTVGALDLVLDRCARCSNLRSALTIGSRRTFQNEARADLLRDDEAMDGGPDEGPGDDREQTIEAGASALTDPDGSHDSVTLVGHPACHADRRRPSAVDRPAWLGRSGCAIETP